MATQELFGRVIEVVTGIQGDEGFKVTAEPTVLTNKPSLRVDFHAQYKTDGKPSKGRAVIFNPPDQMIADLLEGERSFLSISAGYVDRFGTVFAGIPVRDGTDVVKTSGGDVKLTVTAVSGGPRYRRAVAELSLGGRQKAKDVAEQVVNDAGWEIGKNEIDDAIVYPRGFAFAGNASEALHAIARKAQVEVSIVGDRVDLLNPIAVTNNAEEVTKFSSRPDRANLIGQVTKTDKGLRFRGLLEPDVLPGTQVVLEYFDLRKGDWVEERVVLREVTYKGSNYGKDFYIDGIGRPIRS